MGIILCSLSFSKRITSGNFNKIMNKINFLYFIFASLFAIASCNAQQATPDYSKSKLIDVRTPEEFAEGSVVGAINIPVDDIESRLSEINTNDQIVVFCRSGSRSARATSILQKHGYKHVINGGTWQQVNAVVNSKKSKK
jgi:rhodanese-related sulfurtransferase